ncbi:ThiF family adenylyltransferase [Rhodobacteraceae bacterium F11138]|nr:ThiF family adenylyltransferase [Rhodobacteraceae bacterium F11138]
MNRYARQMVLPGIGAQGQARLAAAHVAVVGAGGLGCPVLQYLAGAGVGRITVLDPDHVEVSNLHRQPLYRMSDLGRSKAVAARDHMLALNPSVDVAARTEALHPGNAAALVADADLVIDAADSFAVSYILSDVCLAGGTPLISASALGSGGYVGGFCGAAPSLRAVFPDPPTSGASCATAGVMGPVVAMIGSLQAQMALQVLLDLPPLPLGRMITLDSQGFRFGGFRFDDASEPPDGLPFVSRAELSAADRVVDLRSASETPDRIVAQAERQDPDRVQTDPARPDQRVVLCCASGLRAWRVANRLRARGHRNLALLAASACG